MPFKAPNPPGAGVTLKDLNGRLLLIKVIDTDNIPTAYGDADVIRCDIAVLDGPDKGTEYDDTLLFGRVVVAQLNRCLGETVLARVGQGNAKPGQSPPWMLDGPTDNDQQTATKYQAWKLSQAAATVEVEDDTEEPF